MGRKQRKRKQRKHKKIMISKKQGILFLSAFFMMTFLVLLVVYIVGLNRYQSCFLHGTLIDEVDVSGMSIAQLEEQIGQYSLHVIERQADGTVLEEEILGREIGLAYISTEHLQDVLQQQNPYLWFLKQESVYETDTALFYEEDVLEEKIDALRGFQKEFVKEPADAYIGDYIPGKGFELVAENRGNRLNRARTAEAVKEAVGGLQEQVDLEAAGCYEEPKVTLEDAGLKETYGKLQNYVNTVVTYTFGTQREVLDADTVAGWIIRKGNQAELDPELVKEYVNSLRKKHDTIFHRRTFLTSYGEEVTIDQGDYGWWMDVGQETEELIGLLERGESTERIPVYRQTAASFETPDYGDSYVEINLTAQHLFLYQNGECVLESDFVSGNPSRGNETPAGIYGITYKERDATLTGETYRTPVSFWMPFNNNVGMHDASWRSEFGRNIYMTNGSHGCINLPYSAAEEIYGYVEKGTPVICYHLPGTEPEPLPEIPLEPETEPVPVIETEPGAGPVTEAGSEPVTESGSEQQAVVEEPPLTEGQ